MSLARLNDYQLALWQQSQIQDKEPLGQCLWGFELPFTLQAEPTRAIAENILADAGDLASRVVSTEQTWDQMLPSESWFVVNDQRETQDEVSINELCQTYAEHIFQLDKAPLCRFILIQLPEEKSLLLFQFHSVLINPFQAQTLLLTLSARLQGEEAPLPSLDMQWDGESERLACIPDLKAFQHFEFNLKFVSPIKNPLKHHRSSACAIPWQKEVPMLESFANQAGTDFEKVLMAACLVAISRFTMKKRFVIGYSHVVEHTLKAIPALFQVEPQSGFLDFVQNFHRQIKADIRQETTLHQLQAALKSQGGVSSQQNVNVLWQQMPNLTTVFDAHQGQMVEALPQWIGHDLEFYFQPETKQLSVHYRRGQFSKAWIKNFVEHILLILAQGVRMPKMALCKQRLSSDQNIQAFLIHNHPAQASSRETLLSLMERNVRQYPDKTAIRIDEAELTYAELDSQAETMAGWIQQHYQTYYGETMPRQVMVGIACAPTIDLYVSLLACLKCAAIFVIIDQNFPIKRVKHIVRNADMKMLIGDKDWKYGQVHPKMCYLDVQTLVQEGNAARQVHHQLQKVDYAYGIYTSGSTGFPKGVQISHQQIVSYVLAMKEKLSLDEDLITLSVTHCSFDMFISDVFLTWCLGGELHYAHELISHPKVLAKELQKNQANLMFATPTVWGLLIHELKSIKHECHLLVGGEALKPDLAKKLLKISPDVWNMYGTTETTIVNAVHRVTEDNLTSIGTSLANSHLSVLDRYYRQVPPFMPGNLYVSGQAVGEGYIHHRDAYHQFAIQTISFGEQPLDQVWCFATRDRVYADEAGDIFFLNRADQQYKLRGYRIEVEEVDELVKRHPKIDQAKAVIQPLQQQIIVYYTTKRRTWWQRLLRLKPQLSHQELQTFAEKYLPHYMLPSAWVEIEKIPTDLSGKFNQNALPKPQQCDFVVHENEMIPNDHIESRLRVLWQQVLGLEKIGMEQNFFHIGGYSIRAIELAGLVNKHLGVELPAAWIYHHTSIRSQAHQLRMLEEKIDTHQTVIKFGEKGQQPLFMIHPGWVGSECYEHFAASLPKHFVGIALDLLNLGGQSIASFDSIEEYAAEYVKHMREIQPEGPYFIAGWSFGGYVAFAIAQQLIAAGEVIGGLYMMDVQRFRPGLAERVVSVIQKDSSPDKRVDAQKTEPRLLRYLRQLPTEYRQKVNEDHIKLLEWCEQYNIQPYGGRVLFFWALRNRFLAEPAIREPNYGWSRWIEELCVLTIDGDHFDLLEPGYAEHLAERVGHDMQKSIEALVEVV